MENAVEEIKKKIDIVEFIGSFITLKKTGRNFKAVCPFHQEKTPSFVVSPERQIWHCFGACQDGGDAIKFLMKWENITFFEALQELADKAGIKLKRTQYEDSTWKKKERLTSINTLSADFFEYILHKSAYAKKARDYLKSRGINTQLAKKFQLGYAPNSWDSLLQYLKKKKYDSQEIFETGLLVKGERGGMYDRFRGRLMFPIKDPRGNIIAFSGRNLISGDSSAKYINIPETLLYHKRETLFGIDLAKDTIKKEKNAYIVEGEFDMITPYRFGYTNFVAIKGSALTKEQLMMLKRYSDRITLALDTDAAGEEAMKRGIEEAEHFDFEIAVVTFNYAKDPDEALQKDPEQFKKTLKKPVPIYDFLISLIQKKYPEQTPFNTKKIGDEVIPYIERIQNPILQSFYVKKISTMLGVSESSIMAFMRKIRLKKKQSQVFSSIIPKQKETTRELLLQQYMLSLMFQYEEPYKVADEIFGLLTKEDFSTGSYQKICTMFMEFKTKFPEKFVLDQFAKSLPSELHPVFDQIFLFASSDLGFEHENIMQLAYGIKRFALKRAINDILSKESVDTDESKIILKSLTKQLKEVEKKATTL